MSSPTLYFGNSLMLFHRAGVTIGDGCVIGAGSVVTRSMPAYHVVIGSPARAYQKVAPAVPDAPGLIYEVKGDRVVVVGNRASKFWLFGECPETSGQEKKDSGLQSLGWIGISKARAAVSPGERLPAATQVCVLVAAVALWYWLRTLV